MSEPPWPRPRRSPGAALEIAGDSGAVLAMIPCTVVYVSLQRFYVRGLVSGALKG